jgi:hypothetical protein
MSQRACGTCTLCCKVMGIVELEKPKGSWCDHAVPGQGCSIYAERPHSCRVFSCLWLLDEGLGEEWKPEKSKLVIVPDTDPRVTKVFVDGASPDAWKREPYYSSLLDFMQRGMAEGRLLFINVGNKNSLLLPDARHGWRLEDVGNAQAGDEIRLKRIGPPFAARYEVEIIRRTV